MKKILAVLALLLIMAGAAFALSDEEFITLKESNSDFAKADQKLNQVWRKLKATCSESVFYELTKSEEEWIASVRDEEAKKYMRKGYSRAEAYTMATNNRADKLPEIARSIAKSLRKRK